MSKDVNKIDLKGTLIMLITIVAGYGVLKLLAFIYLLIVGATANVATSGDIAVPTAINTSISTTVTETTTGFAAIATGELVVLGLIGLVVILKVFWPMIKGSMPKTGGKEMN